MIPKKKNKPKKHKTKADKLEKKPAARPPGNRGAILQAELVASALTELSGNIAAVARRFNVSRSAVANMIADNEILRKVADDCRQSLLDNAESALTRAVLAGEAWAVCFFLKTQGKKRGYIERQQIEHSETAPTDVQEEVLATRTTEAEGQDPTHAAAGPVPR